jgi:phage terminase large subunit-like protein
VIFDEVWNQRKRDLWEALVGSLIKRPEALLICISSAGYDQDSLLWDLCKRGQAGNDPRFFYQWHQAPEDLAYDDPETWKVANPALSCEEPFLQLAGLEDSLQRMHESEFRRWHLGQWTAADDAWMGADMWDANDGKPELLPQRRTVLGVDASIRHDSTVVATVQKDEDGIYHAEFEVWDPKGKDIRMELVVAYIREQTKKYNVTSVCYDPQFMHHAAQTLESEGIVMRDWKQDNARMVPATRTLYEAIKNRKVRHGGHAVARSHALAAGVSVSLIAA